MAAHWAAIKYYLIGLVATRLTTQTPTRTFLESVALTQTRRLTASAVDTTRTSRVSEPVLAHCDLDSDLEGGFSIGSQGDVCEWDL